MLMDTCHIFFLHSIVHHIFIVLHIFPPLTSTPSTNYQQIVFSTCWLIYSKYSYYFPLMKIFGAKTKFIMAKFLIFPICPNVIFAHFWSTLNTHHLFRRTRQDINRCSQLTYWSLWTFAATCIYHNCERRQQALKPDREMGCCLLKKGPTGQILSFRSLQPAPLFWPQQC